jgi:hypothetical protein
MNVASGLTDQALTRSLLGKQGGCDEWVKISTDNNMSRCNLQLRLVDKERLLLAFSLPDSRVNSIYSVDAEIDAYLGGQLHSIS